eukprot:5846830-Pleurochrysis_carterae.AAC.1
MRRYEARRVAVSTSRTGGRCMDWEIHSYDDVSWGCAGFKELTVHRLQTSESPVPSPAHEYVRVSRQRQSLRAAWNLNQRRLPADDELFGVVGRGLDIGRIARWEAQAQDGDVWIRTRIRGKVYRDAIWECTREPWGEHLQRWCGDGVSRLIEQGNYILDGSDADSLGFVRQIYQAGSDEDEQRGERVQACSSVFKLVKCT